jgi:hypothetical protein
VQFSNTQKMFDIGTARIVSAHPMDMEINYLHIDIISSKKRSITMSNVKISLRYVLADDVFIYKKGMVFDEAGYD